MSAPTSLLSGLPSNKLASLRTISLYELKSGSVSEQNLLLQTAITDGFFYLDLTHPEFSSLLADIEAVFNLSEHLFNYPPEIKSLFDVDQISPLKINGYKPKGRNVVGNGKRDGFESWVVSQHYFFSHSQGVNKRLIHITYPAPT